MPGRQRQAMALALVEHYRSPLDGMRLLMSDPARAADDLGLAGKVAIVTGGGAPDDGIGNGRAAAILLARAGAKVLVVDIIREAAEQTVAMIHNEGGEAVPFVADVSDEAQCRALVETA